MPPMMHIQADLLLFLQDRGHGVVALDAETNLFDSEILDSLMLLDLILHIQRAHGVTLEASDVTQGNFSNVAALAQLVARRADRVSNKAA